MLLQQIAGNRTRPLQINSKFAMSSIATNAGTADSGDFVQVSDLDDTSATSPPPVKTQVLPFVYIQTPNTKLPFASIPKTSSNVIVNTVPQLQFNTLPQNVANTNTKSRNVVANSSVILAPVKGKTQQLVIHKPVVPVTSGSKFAGAYLTMLKPVTKTAETSTNSLNNVPSSNSGQKYVIAPMAKVLKNRAKTRLPVVIPSNNAQSSFTFMPLTLPASSENSSQSIFNIKISEGQIREELADKTGNCNKNSTQSDLTCNEVIDLDSPVKSEKEYELSIVEDSQTKTETDFAFTEESSKRKDGPKLAKHGISILKKKISRKFQNCEKVRKKINSTPIVVDCPETKVEPVAAKPQKPERRRKSNFAYRKDYDDMEVEIKIEKKSPEREVAVRNSEIKSEPEDCDVKNILKWEEGIGSLPGSALKFIINEFNLVEYVTSEEYDKILEKRLTKIKTKSELQEDLRCAECGCYGLPSEFITPKYCSLDCQEAGRVKEFGKDYKLKQRKRKRTFAMQKSELEPSASEEDNTSNENSQDKFSYPWTCSKKGFSWTKYLDHIKAKAAPVKLFKDAFPYNRNGFRAGMKLEGMDPYHPSYFCVLSVSKTCGYRVRLHFDGYPDNYDFWVNADSIDIFPAGWCEKHGHVLQPPPNYTVENFNWVHYLKQTKSTAAPKHLFANRAGNTICPNGFRVGMKLEAVDRKNNTSLVCVATVKDMVDNRILIHFDSWGDIYDYWADPTSPYIHPVGWCDQHGHNLTAPNGVLGDLPDYPDPETFSWNRYLKETKSVAAPVRAFKQRPTCGFKTGMRLECVDKRVPQLIRVATVSDVRDHQIRILFDGWPDRYSYWVDDDSDDIHPAGWCQKTGHPIETPLTPDDVYDFLECPTIGCRGLGHTEGAKFASHSEQKYCPYAEDNIDIDRRYPDRLLTPDRCVEEAVPVSREPKEVGKHRHLIKYARSEDGALEDVQPEVKKPKRKYTKRVKLDVKEINKIEANSLIAQAKIDPAEKESWPKHSQFLYRYIEGCGDVRRWRNDKVAEYVAMLPGCSGHAEQFREMEIDGEAFLLLSKSDLLDLLKMKMGPAIKLHSVIVLLRERVCRIFS